MAESRTSVLKGLEPWEQPVRALPGLVHLAPQVAHPDDPLTSVVESFARDRGASAVFVVDADDRLIGAIPEKTLDLGLLTLALPERLWPSLREMDTRDVLRVARGGPRYARDLLHPVRSVKPESTLREALALMTHAGQSVVALVDERDRLLGYLSLFEVLAHLLSGARG
jgi:CBS domain-containing protein